MPKKTNLSMKVIALAIMMHFGSHAATPNATEEWFIADENCLFMSVISLSALGSYMLMPLYYAKTGTVLEDTDPFKQLVLEEFRQMGLSYDNSFQVIVNVEAEAAQMMVIRNCLIVAPSIYNAHQQGQVNANPTKLKERRADINEIRFALRHEASHLKHHDVPHRIAWYLILYAAANWGIGKLIKSTTMNEHLIRSIYKGAFMGVYFFINGTGSYYQEIRADKEAASDATLALAGAQFFERMEERIPNYSAFNRWLCTQPFLFRIVTGYQTFRERAEMAQKIALGLPA